MAMLMLCPAVLISIGNISLGISQDKGPHDHPKPAEYMHIRISNNVACPFDIGFVPDTPSSAASRKAIVTFKKEYTKNNVIILANYHEKICLNLVEMIN